MSTVSNDLDRNSWREFDPQAFHVMIADDQIHLREIVGNVLRKEGYGVTLVEDGEQLLEEARLNPPDLIVLDVMMPRLDGLSALRQLRADPRLCSAYVLILSGQATLEEKLAGFAHGADDYLTKPYSIDELRARVRSGIRLRAVERHLEHSQQLVVRQEKLATIGSLASGIAHEFNNIMSGIAGFAQLATRNPKFQKRLVEIALQQARRAEKITSSLSTFASTASPRFERSPIEPLLESARMLVRQALVTKSATLEHSIEPDLPTLDLNRGQIQQVLLHLLINAQESIAEDGTISVDVRREQNVVVIEVDDDGPGISDENVARIFDPFFTTMGALGASEGEGTGLGLTFSLNVAVAHEGTIELVNSKLGGACLQLRLPIPKPEPAIGLTISTLTGAQESELLLAVENVIEHREGPEARPMQIAMVEDDLTLQEVVSELLTGAEVHCFSSGPEAVEHCRNSPVDVVLLDIHLHGPWDGWRVLEELGVLDCSPPVILTTGIIEVAVDQIDYPQLELLRKPFRLGELELALTRVARSADPLAPQEAAAAADAGDSPTEL